MRMKGAKILFFAQFLLFQFSRAEFCYESHGLILNNQLLIGHTYKSVRTRGMLGCGHKCLADPVCTSYSYQTLAIQDGVCELHDGSMGKEELFEERQGFVFVRMRRKTKPKTCLEAWKQGARKSGFYFMQGRTECLFYEMFCDFSSEPGWAWTLVMSQSFRSSSESFAKTSFLDGRFKNQRTPNWERYRIGGSRMKIIKEQSSHWRVTCDFPPFGAGHTDYVRATFENLDPLKYDASGECREMDHINIRGHNCTKCTAAWWQTKNQFLTHFSDQDSCQFGTIPGSLSKEANFGGYWKNNASLKFRCSANETSSTNHWFGSRV